MDLVERFCPGCGAACAVGAAACGACGMSLRVTRKLDEKVLAAPPALRLATHLQNLQLFQNRYRIVRQVGVGGFGAVYEALDTWESRKVAIKEIGLGGLSAQQVIEATDAFNREVQMLSSLRHPGIPRMYEQLTDAAHWYLVMEFIAGQTLEKVQEQASQGRLPLERVVSLGLQICVILEYLHRQQPAVIFRDLKPANIMLTPQGNLYLIDFGVARRYQRSKTRDTVAFGSPGYAAPEQYGRAQTTPLADIYSLGALLYCLISGDDPSEHPFKFPPLRLYGVDGIRELDALIQRMVASDPLQRPQRPGAELRRIQQMYYQNNRRQAPIWIPPRGQTPPSLVAVSSSGTSQQQQQQQHVMPATSTGAGSQQTASKKTSRRRLLVVAGTLMVLGTGIAWAVSNVHQSPLTISNPPQGVAVPTQASADLTPSGSDQQPVVPNDGPTFWSADLRNAVVTSASALEVYATHPQKLLFSIPIGPYYLESVAWAKDNSKFFFTATNTVYSARTGKKLYTLPAAVEWANTNNVSWSPDGQYLMGSSANFDANSSPQTSIGIFSAKNGKRLFAQTIPGNNIANCMTWAPDGRYVAFPNSDSATWVVGQSWSVGILDVKEFRQVAEFKGTIPPGFDMNASSFARASGIAWSPDGMTIAIVVDTHAWLSALAYDASGWQFTNALNLDVPLGSVPLWSPDSSYIAFFSFQDINIYEVATGQNVAYMNTEPLSSIVAATWSADSKQVIAMDDNNISSTWTLI